MAGPQLNPFVGNFPYPTMFDPSQWSNPYDQVQGINFSPYNYYAQQPTNALGQPIQSYQPPPPPAAPPQGMTLNSNPSSNQSAINQLVMGSPNERANQFANFAGIYPSSFAPGNIYAGGQVNPNFNGNTAVIGPYGTLLGQQGQQGGGAQQPAVPSAGQAYLNALSNPGPVTTPGAPIPPGPPQYQPAGGNVLQSFLAQRGQNPGMGVGGGFINNLTGMAGGSWGGR